MYSLFTKIFLSFWLAALLLAATMFAAENYLGEDAINRETQRIDAHATTLSTLLNDEGMPAVYRWMGGMVRREHIPLVLLDSSGHLLEDQPLPPPLRERMEEQVMEPGVHTVREGVIAIVRPVPNTMPPLFLGAIVHLKHAREIPLWARLTAAIIVSCLVSLGLAALITRPVRRLRHAAQSFAEGDLGVRVPVRGRDEVAALGNDFNTMADRLRDLLEAQRRLLRDVSHELRSPLARLRVALELGRKKGDTAMVMERIEREADRLESLVSDVLSLSRLEAGNYNLKRQAVALDELLAVVAQDAAFEAEAQNKVVQGDFAGDVVVYGDPVLLRSALENVIRNAVRYTLEGTSVLLSLHVEEAEAVVSVRDHGEGVPENEIGKLFQPFTRVGEARDRARGGYGLGLAISRQAVEAHGGKIGAANVQNGGLVVTLRLPLARQADHR